MPEPIVYKDKTIDLVDPIGIPELVFYGREDELAACGLAWGLGNEGKIEPRMKRFAFRLAGVPGVGKNAIVYELVSRMRKVPGQEDMPFYMIQGHEEFTPEDLALSVVPAEEQGRFRLQASGLATAIYKGGVCFVDEINRIPPRALSLLVSALDEREQVFSAMTNLWIESPEDRTWPFFFCCAMNTNAGAGEVYALPENIRQRTLPRIDINGLPTDELMKVVSKRLDTAPRDIQQFYSLIERIVQEQRSQRELETSLELWQRKGGEAKDLDQFLEKFLKESPDNSNP